VLKTLFEEVAIPTVALFVSQAINPFRSLAGIVLLA
jgi:hypothetical protein